MLRGDRPPLIISCLLLADETRWDPSSLRTLVLQFRVGAINSFLDHHDIGCIPATTFGSCPATGATRDFRTTPGNVSAEGHLPMRPVTSALAGKTARRLPSGDTIRRGRP